MAHFFPGGLMLYSLTDEDVSQPPRDRRPFDAQDGKKGEARFVTQATIIPEEAQTDAGAAR